MSYNDHAFNTDRTKKLATTANGFYVRQYAKRPRATQAVTIAAPLLLLNMFGAFGFWIMLVLIGLSYMLVRFVDKSAQQRLVQQIASGGTPYGNESGKEK